MFFRQVWSAGSFENKDLRPLRRRRHPTKTKTPKEMMTPCENEDALLFRAGWREQPNSHHMISGLQTAEPQKYLSRDKNIWTAD